jgi:DNA repair photolyase
MAGFAQLSLELMVARAEVARKANEVKKLNVVYEPGGRAREYAAQAVNLYSGCGHKCSYCYAPAALQRNRQDFYEKPGPRARDFWNKLEHDLKLLGGRPNMEPVLLCFSCDAYQPIDVEYGYARKALSMFKRHNVPFQVLSKGGMRCARDFDLYEPGRDIYAATMTFMSADKSARWEPGAALPAERIDALKLAHEMGIKTWVSLEPVIEPLESLACIDACANYVDGFKVGTWNHDKRAKEIDWFEFGHEAVAKIEGYGKELYVKKDLKELM